MPKSNLREASAYEILSTPKERRLEVFRNLDVNKQGFTLLAMPRRIQKEILQQLRNEEIVRIVDYLDPDEATDLLQVLPASKRNAVLKDLAKEIRAKIEFLLKFDPRTAAGLMSLDYIEVEQDARFEELAKTIKKHEKRTGKFPTILIVKDGFLVGELPAHVLAIAKKNEKIGKYARKVPAIEYDKDEKEVIATFRKHAHDKIVVLDKDKSILGLIYSDDILRLIERRSANTLREFAGVSEEEDVFDPPIVKVKHRYKWLIINLATAFLAASVVALFQKTISAFVLLAVYMPIVAGMGGNAGTQTLAVVVRALALREIELKTARKVIFNEMLAGAINGIIIGTLVALVAAFWNSNPLLGLVVGIAMIINLVIAGLFGAIVPLVMKKLGKDPASSATVFITTATDVCGFFSFLGLASLFL
ncbi:magnesium transporter [Candidatus Pacearchaeota archaeon]|nr:MAG: magnesium transporter [Candidatus Pacearchaeota archaeon]